MINKNNETEPRIVDPELEDDETLEEKEDENDG